MIAYSYSMRCQTSRMWLHYKATLAHYLWMQGFSVIPADADCNTSGYAGGSGGDTRKHGQKKKKKKNWHPASQVRLMKLTYSFCTEYGLYCRGNMETLSSTNWTHSTLLLTCRLLLEEDMQSKSDLGAESAKNASNHDLRPLHRSRTSYAFPFYLTIFCHSRWSSPHWSADLLPGAPQRWIISPSCCFITRYPYILSEVKEKPLVQSGVGSKAPHKHQGEPNCWTACHETPSWAHCPCSGDIAYSISGEKVSYGVLKFSYLATKLNCITRLGVV